MVKILSLLTRVHVGHLQVVIHEYLTFCIHTILHFWRLFNEITFKGRPQTLDYMVKFILLSELLVVLRVKMQLYSVFPHVGKRNVLNFLAVVRQKRAISRDDAQLLVKSNGPILVFLRVLVD